MTFTVHFEHPSFWDLFEIHHDKLLPTMRLIAIRYLNRLTALLYILYYLDFELQDFRRAPGVF